jgi:NDP-sugar pyrophosphorylase family protein
MLIDHCLILAAGFGTRMGSIGQKLPKVLWPVFEKSLLELQVAYARSLGIEKIYINLHYMGQQIEEFCKNRPIFEGVTFLWEMPEILDIGGAVHNLASLPNVRYRGKLLILNADQFFYLKKDDLFKILSPYKKSPSVLFSYWVNSSLGYNALSIGADRIMKGIIKNKDIIPGKVIETYTGISYVDLTQLEPIPGPSKFFDSVCPFLTKEIPTILLENIDYWDFGTLERYWESCFNIIKKYKIHSAHPFLRFLIQEKALKSWKINLQKISYHSKSSGVINLNQDEEIRDLSPSLILSGTYSENREKPTVWWNNLSEEIKLT